MRWTNKRLEKRIKIYNRIYFNNEIKKPIVFRWSKHLYNTGSSTEAYCQSYKDYHLITFNVTYSNASNEIMRCTLVHEMIHAWQAEHDPNFDKDWSAHEGHGLSFVKKCKELNSKFKFTYPLMSYVDYNKAMNVKKQNKDLYFVYKMDFSVSTPNIKYPVGVFVKFMHENEINGLLSKCISVKYYTKACFKKTDCQENNYKYVIDTDVPVVYSKLKNCKYENFITYIRNEFGLYHMVTDDDFNFDDGIIIEN